MIVAREPFSASVPRRTRRSWTCARGWCCPGSSTRTCTSRRCGRSAGSGCRCSTGWRSARCPRRRGSPTRRTPPRWPPTSSPGWCGPGPRRRWSSARTSPGAVDALFTESARVGLRVTSGLVLSDRILREDLFTTPDRAYDEGLELAKRWHGQGRTRYAVTPRFSLSCTDGAAGVGGCAAGGRAGPLVHLAPQRERRGDRGRAAAVRLRLHDVLRAGRAAGAAERARAQRAPDAAGAALARPPRRGGRALPDVERRPRQRAVPARTRTSPSASGWRSAPTSAPGPASRCSRRGCRPTSSSSCSAARGTGSPRGTCCTWPPPPAPTCSGSRRSIGDFSVGKEFDALWLRPSSGCTLDVALRHAGLARGRAGQGVRAGRARPTWPRRGSPASRSTGCLNRPADPDGRRRWRAGRAGRREGGPARGCGRAALPGCAVPRRLGRGEHVEPVLDRLSCEPGPRPVGLDQRARVRLDPEHQEPAVLRRGEPRPQRAGGLLEVAGLEVGQEGSSSSRRARASSSRTRPSLDSKR